jgi:hypothetical protein
VAVSFISAETHAHFQLIEKRNRVALPREQIPGFEPQPVAAPAPPAPGGIKGRRPSKKDRYRAAEARSARRRPRSSLSGVMLLEG